MTNPLDLSGKMILITGASSGIGRQAAIMCSRLGAKTVLIARREHELKITASLLEGTGHTYYCFDLTQISDIEKLVKTIVNEQGLFDGFVHCAGVSDKRPAALLHYEALHDVMQINFYAFFELFRILAKRAHSNHGFSAVGISSVSSVCGTSAHAAYSASKAAMDGAVRCLAREYAKRHIRVNTIQPSMIATNLYNEYLKNQQGLGEDTITGRQYLGIGNPDDVANAIAFLLSDASNFITGVSLPVDGGFTSC